MPFYPIRPPSRDVQPSLEASARLPARTELHLAWRPAAMVVIITILPARAADVIPYLLLDRVSEHPWSLPNRLPRLGREAGAGRTASVSSAVAPATDGSEVSDIRWTTFITT